MGFSIRDTYFSPRVQLINKFYFSRHLYLIECYYCILSLQRTSLMLPSYCFTMLSSFTFLSHAILSLSLRVTLLWQVGIAFFIHYVSIIRILTIRGENSTGRGIVFESLQSPNNRRTMVWEEAAENGINLQRQ